VILDKPLSDSALLSTYASEPPLPYTFILCVLSLVLVASCMLHHNMNTGARELYNCRCEKHSFASISALTGAYYIKLQLVRTWAGPI